VTVLSDDSRLEQTLHSPRKNRPPSLGAEVRRGAIWSMATTIIMRLSGIGITAVVARILNAHDFGVFSVATTAFVIVTAFAEFGVTSCLARVDLDVEVLAPTLWTVSIGSSLLVAAPLYLFARPIASGLGSIDAASPLRVMAVVVVILGLSAVPTAQCVRDFKQDRIFLANVIAFIPSTFVLLVLAKHGSGGLAFAWSRVVGQAVACTVILFSVPKLHMPGLRRSALSILNKFGVPLAFANFVNYLLGNVDYALIGHFIGPASLGLYVIAFNAASWASSLLGGMLSTVAMPAFSRVGNDKVKLMRAISDGLRAVMLIAAPMCTLITVLARPLVLTVYGNKWTAAVAPLSILAVYGVITIVGQLFSSMLTALGRSKSVLVIQLIWLFTLAPAMAIGVREKGIVGAAIAHVIIIAPIVLPCYVIALKRATGVRLGALVKAALPPLIVAIFAAILAWFAAARFSQPILALTVGLAVGSLFYLLVTAPQLIPLVGRSLASRPQVRRILRVYSNIGRTVGIPMGPPPRHATNRVAKRVRRAH
jgi:lipopolysaccharide exporter